MATKIYASNTIKQKLSINKKILKQLVMKDIHTDIKKLKSKLALNNSLIITTKTSRLKRIFISFTRRLIRAKSPKKTQKVRIRVSIAVIFSDISSRAVLTRIKAVSIKTKIQIIKQTKVNRTLGKKTTLMRVILITELEHKILIRMNMHQGRSKSSTTTISKIIRTSHNSKIIGQTLKRVAIISSLMKKEGTNAQKSLVNMSLKKIPPSILRIVDILNGT